MSSVLPLSDFQREGAEKAVEILKKRGGVLLCDSVGLGKTFTALAVVETFLGQDEEVGICVPAALRRMWRRELKRLPCAQTVSLFSHTAVALGRVPDRPFQLLVIDEAHAFRNPQTLRYKRLRLLCRSSKVMLVTATPVNNSLSDLYFLLRLFCADGLFRDVGVASLRSSLMTRRADPIDLGRIRTAVVIRRTRREIRAGAREFAFPGTVRIHSVLYSPPIEISELPALLAALTFPGHRLGTDLVSVDLLRYGLLKRFDSSHESLRITLTRLMRFCEQLVQALSEGRLLRPREFRTLYEQTDQTLQLVMTAVTLSPARLNSSSARHDVEKEIEVIQSWIHSIRPEDDKLRVLTELLKGRAGERTVVFTEYRDTARYLWSALRRRFPVGLIVGENARLGESPASRAEAIAHFAPRANAAAIHARDAIAVLIATDVMAEGMNLQDADAVVSYDLPWNPVRLIQRAGRVDRMGSAHDTVHVYNFMPDREFDVFLGLLRTLRTKLENVRQTVGLERPVLDPLDESMILEDPHPNPGGRVITHQAPRLDQQSTAARVARLLRRHLAAAQPRHYPRAERLMNRLASVSTVSEEIGLESVLNDQNGTLEVLMDAVENALAERKTPIDRVSGFR